MRKEYDFSKAKPVREIPSLRRLQEENRGKERITIRLDADILDWFKSRVAGGGNYQTLINNALRDHIAESDGTLERVIRKVLREELRRDKGAIPRRRTQTRAHD